MSMKNSVNKWGPLLLLVVCVFLGIRLVSELKAPLVQGGESAGAHISSQPRLPRQSRVKEDEMGLPAAENGSLLQVGVLKQIEQRPKPDIARNPFDYAPVAPPPKQSTEGASTEASSGPPPPPPIPLRAFGFSVDEEGHRHAYLADANEVFVVTKGALISKRFKVLEITPGMVEVEDAASGQKAELPIPQAR